MHSSLLPAVRSMRRSVPADMQANEDLWQQLHHLMHNTLEKAFNEITEAAAKQVPLTLLAVSCMA